jgi:cystathionine beta-lyase
MACHMLDGDDAVLVQPPVYTPILGAPKNARVGCQEAGLSLLENGTYVVDYEAFEAAITPQTRLFMLCNPHNPVGKVFTPDELSRMADICLRHDVLICSDEIHCDLVFSNDHHKPIASLDKEIADNTITLMAPSKTFNLAGLKCSFAIIPNPELRRRFKKAQKGLVGGLNLMGIVAALAAYRHGDEWLRQMLAYLEANRDYLCDYVNENLPGVSMAKPQGTYLAWLNCREASIEGISCNFFLDHARVALGEGEAFGDGGEGFVRLNFGCSRSLLEQALERMRLSLERLTV